MDLTNKWVKCSQTFFKLQKLYIREYNWKYEAKGIGFDGNKVIDSIEFDDMSDLVICNEFELITSAIKNGLSLSELGICKDVDDLKQGISDIQDILSREETYGMDEMFRLKIQEYKTKIFKLNLYYRYVHLGSLVQDGHGMLMETQRDEIFEMLNDLNHIKLIEQ